MNAKKKINLEDSALLDKFIRLVNVGREGAEIASQLGLTTSQAERLHYRLVCSQKLPAQVIDFTSLRELSVGESGGVFISETRLKSLGATAKFPPRAILNCVFENEKIILEPVLENGEIKLAPEKEKKPRKKKKGTPEANDNKAEGSESAETSEILAEEVSR